MVIHVTALCILTFLKVLPQTATLYGILEGKELKISQSELTRFVIQFCTYSLSLIFVSFIVGKAMKFLVERKHLDVQFQALRTTNYWYQIFSGRYLERIGAQGNVKKIDFIFFR